VAFLIGVALLTAFIQVAAASTECPQCKVVYSNDVMTINAASVPRDALTRGGPLALLDPSAFHSPSEVNIADIVFKLL
jgi:hypothetical protein